MLTGIGRITCFLRFASVMSEGLEYFCPTVARSLSDIMKPSRILSHRSVSSQDLFNPKRALPRMVRLLSSPTCSPYPAILTASHRAGLQQTPTISGNVPTLTDHSEEMQISPTPELPYSNNAGKPNVSYVAIMAIRSERKSLNDGISLLPCLSSINLRVMKYRMM